MIMLQFIVLNYIVFIVYSENQIMCSEATLLKVQGYNIARSADKVRKNNLTYGTIYKQIY